MSEGNRAKFVFGLSLLFFAFVNIISLVKDDGILDVNRFEVKIGNLRKELHDNLLKNKILREKIKSLDQDETIERIAREQLGLVRPGEVVYEFVPKNHLSQFLEQRDPSPQPSGFSE